MYLSRRRFVRGLAAGGAAAAFGSIASAQSRSPRKQDTLRGTAFDLSIGETAMNFTGSTKIAQAINGSIPGPLLRWREGRHRHAARRQSARRGHVDPLARHHPAGRHGRRARPQLSRHPRRGETYTYRFEVKQAGTYWYHSHSGFQEQRGVYGPLVIEPREPDPIASIASTSSCCPTGPTRSRARLREAQEAIRLLQLPQAHARRLPQGRARGTGSADARRSNGLGRDAHEPDRPRRRWRRHLHAPDERRHAGRQLDRAVHIRRAGAAALHQRLGDDVLRRPHSRPEDDRRRRRRPARASGDGRRVPHRDRRNVRRHRRAVRAGRLHDLRAGDGSHGVCGRHARGSRGPARAGAGARSAAAV